MLTERDLWGRLCVNKEVKDCLCVCLEGALFLQGHMGHWLDEDWEWGRGHTGSCFWGDGHESKGSFICYHRTQDEGSVDEDARPRTLPMLLAHRAIRKVGSSYVHPRT